MKTTKVLVLQALMLALLVVAPGCGDDEKGSKSDCEKACERAEAANCPNDDPLGVCVSDCNELLAMPTCQAEARAAVACLAGATFVCDPEFGTVEPTGCDAQLLAYFNCLP